MEFEQQTELAIPDSSVQAYKGHRNFSNRETKPEQHFVFVSIEEDKVRT
jgi:hypothetical protein